MRQTFSWLCELLLLDLRTTNHPFLLVSGTIATEKGPGESIASADLAARFVTALVIHIHHPKLSMQSTKARFLTNKAERWAYSTTHMLTAWMLHIDHSRQLMRTAVETAPQVGRIEARPQNAAVRVGAAGSLDIHHAFLLMIVAEQSSWGSLRSKHWLCLASILCTPWADHVDHASLLVGKTVQPFAQAFHVEAWPCEAARLSTFLSILVCSPYPWLALFVRADQPFEVHSRRCV